MEEKPNLLESLADLLKKEGVDRRNFIKLATAAGISVCTAQKLMAAPNSGCLKCHSKAPAGFVLDPNTEALINHAHDLGIDLVWDRGALCSISHKGQGGVSGACCFRCQMGPCTLGPATGQDRGACGATVDIIAARGLVRRVAGGTSAHVEHARAAAKTLKGVAEQKIPDYGIVDTAKLEKIYVGLGLSGAYTSLEKALAVATKTLEDLNKDDGIPAWLEYKASQERRATWEALGILPTGGGTEISEAMHRTTMGVDGDMAHLATDALKLGIVDGYCGLHAATGIQDVLFGTPMAVFSKAGLSVIEEDKINVIIHGHEPILSEKIVEAANAYNAANPLLTQINVAGICCTANEALMRKGVKAAGSMVQAELALATGAVEAMVVDVQCVIPNVEQVASQFHTKLITTNPHAKIEGVPPEDHMEFKPENANTIAQQIIKKAVNNYPNRGSVFIPSDPPKDIVAGFSVEQIVAALSAVNPNDPIGLLINLIISNDIRGIVGIVGCVTPRDTYGYRHVALTKRLLAENILVVGTGCWSHVAGQYGFLTARDQQGLIDFGVGEKLAGVLQTVATKVGLAGLPPCWHMGSCVDNSRIEDVLNAVTARLSQMVGPKKISDLPVAASAPEFITEKAVSIGTWAVDLGLFTHIGGQPYVSGSANLVDLLTNGVEGLTGGKFYVEIDPEIAADTIIAKVNEKRQALGLGT